MLLNITLNNIYIYIYVNININKNKNKNIYINIKLNLAVAEWFSNHYIIDNTIIYGIIRRLVHQHHVEI